MYRILGADNQEYGPVNADQIRQWIAEGRVNAQTPIRAEDSVDWKRLADFPELAGPLPMSAAPAQRIPNYLVQAILVTICCCMPFGIPAIVFAAQVNGKLASGDLAGAEESSRKAKMWCWVAFGLGIVGNLLGSFFWFGSGRHHFIR